MKTINQGDFQNKTVIVRVDFNVPLNDKYEITDDRRITAAIPTINYLLDNGAAVILMSHLGRPKDGPTDKYSLKHIQNHLSDLLKKSVLFVNDCIGNQAVETCKNLVAGDVVLLENLRFYKEEEKGNVEFAQKLANLAQVYVNDAFGTAHRAHASTSIIAQFMPEKYAGFLMVAEVENAKKVLDHVEKPYVAIVGGAKVSDKILIIEQLLNKVDEIIIGGGMAYTFLKAQGKEIGKSLCELDKLDLANEILAKAKEKGVTILLPIDSVVASEFNNNSPASIVSNDQIPTDKMGLDIGPKSVEAANLLISKAKTILWNGPMGVFEMSNFSNGTFSIAKAIADATSKGTYSLIGGGDSASAIDKAGLEDKVSYVSTGGGALLEYLEGKVLPGIEALG